MIRHTAAASLALALPVVACTLGHGVAPTNDDGAAASDASSLAEDDASRASSSQGSPSACEAAGGTCRAASGAAGGGCEASEVRVIQGAPCDDGRATCCVSARPAGSRASLPGGRTLLCTADQFLEIREAGRCLAPSEGTRPLDCEAGCRCVGDDDAGVSCDCNARARAPSSGEITCAVLSCGAVSCGEGCACAAPELSQCHCGDAP